MTRISRLPFALCLLAVVLPVSPVAYLAARDSTAAAIAILLVMLAWSTALAHFSASELWKRNAWWLLFSVLGVSIIYLITFRLDNDVSGTMVIRKLASVYFQAIVAVAVALTLLLLNLFSFAYTKYRR